MSDELIAALVADLRPIRRLASPRRRAARFGGLACGAVAMAVSLVGLRQDLTARLQQAPFLGETLLLFVLFGAATCSALGSSVPGAALRGAGKWVIAALGAWLVLIAARYTLEPSARAVGHGMPCVRRMLVLGSGPACVLLIMLRRAAPLRPGTSGLLAFLSAGSLGVLGTRLLCSKEEPLHVLLWHFMPLVAVAVLGSLCGRRWLG
jgi:hypothetical protein